MMRNQNSSLLASVLGTWTYSDHGMTTLNILGNAKQNT